MTVNTTRWNRIRYTLYAPVYDAVVRLLDGERRRAVELAAVQPGERVLIVGAGTGRDLDYLPRGCEVTAIDLTPAMLSRLRRRAARLGRPVDARVMDAQRLDLPDGHFDCVLLHLIVAVIPDPDACVREAARVLKPGGRISIFDKFQPDERPPSVGRRLANVVTSTLFSDITRQLGPILERAGLSLRVFQRTRLPLFVRVLAGHAEADSPRGRTTQQSKP